MANESEKVQAGTTKDDSRAAVDTSKSRTDGLTFGIWERGAGMLGDFLFCFLKDSSGGVTSACAGDDRVLYGET
jgi:hypothetical protein